VKDHWWEYLLHNHRAARLRSALLKRGRHPLVVINIPWHLDRRADRGLVQSSTEGNGFTVGPAGEQEDRHPPGTSHALPGHR
jgi:hypothetical protein